MLSQQQIMKRLQRLGNANQLMAQELSDLQKELELSAPVPQSRKRLKVVRKTKYSAMLIKPLKAS